MLSELRKLCKDKDSFGEVYDFVDECYDQVAGFLSDEDGKTCDGESSYVTASLEGEKTKIKANLVCGNASSYSLVYMSENDSEVDDDTVETKSVTVNSNKSNTAILKIYDIII